MADQLGAMSDHMLQIVRSAFEEEQPADAIEALNDAFIQGQMPSRHVFYALLALVNGAPEFGRRRGDSVDAALHRKIGRFEWEDMQPSIIVASMSLLKRYVAVNPDTVARYLSPAQDKTSEEGWLGAFGVDGSSGSDSDGPEEAPLIPILRLASTMSACDNVWQMLSLPVPKWTANGGLTGSPGGRKDYAMLHEGDFDEQEDRKKRKRTDSGEEEKRLQRIGSWRLMDIFLTLWSGRQGSITTHEDHFTHQLQSSSYGKGRRHQAVGSGRVTAVQLVLAGLSCGHDWEVPRDDVVAPASAACKLFDLLVKRCHSNADRDLIADHIAEYCRRMDSKSLVTFAKMPEDAEQLILLGALRHLHKCGKNWRTKVDELRLQKAGEAASGRSDCNDITREILSLVGKPDWLKVPSDWASIERGIIEVHEEEGEGAPALRSTEAILDSPAWALQSGTEARSVRTRTKERKSSAGSGHGMLALVEATVIRLETVGWFTRRIELQAYICHALFRRVDRDVGSICAESVCDRGSMDLAGLRTISERMRPSLSKLVNDSLRVPPPAKFARKRDEKRIQQVSYISSDDDSSGVEEVRVPAHFTSHMKQCKASLTEMRSLLDHAEARLEILRMGMIT